MEGGLAERKSALMTQYEGMFNLTDCNDRFREFIEGCVKFEADKRMTIDEIMET